VRCDDGDANAVVSVYGVCSYLMTNRVTMITIVIILSSSFMVHAVTLCMLVIRLEVVWRYLLLVSFLPTPLHSHPSSPLLFLSLVDLASVG
jgi:hypothetical protein